MFQALGRCTASHPWWICMLWVVLGAGLTVGAPRWDTRTEDDDVRFVPERFTSVRAYEILTKAFPDDVFASRVAFALERDQEPLRDSDFLLVDALVQDLEQLRQQAPTLQIGKIESYQDHLVGARLTSPDRQCTLIQVSLSTPYMAIATQAAVDRTEQVLRQRLAKHQDTPQLFTTGAAGIGRDLTKICGESLESTTWATILLVIVVLLFVYRAPLLALVPLFTIGISVWVSLKLLALMTLLPGVHLVNISKIFAIVILYGAGTDYCLFLISRYREELHDGSDVHPALVRSIGSVGEALAASAGTVMVGLGLMGFAEFTKVRFAGPAIAICLGVALAASLTLTPALLSLMGKVVFWPGRAPSPKSKKGLARRLNLADEGNGFWTWVSERVAARPILVWSGAVLILLPFIFIGLQVKPNYRATSELSPQSQSLRGLAAVQRHFTAGAVGPISVLLVADRDWTSREGQLEIDHLSRGFAQLPRVAEVRSLTQPLGMARLDLTPAPGKTDWLNRLLTLIGPFVESMQESITQVAKEHYVSALTEEGTRHAVTRLEVILTSDPFDDESIDSLQYVQTWLRTQLPRSNFLGGNIQAECYGITAIGQDLAQVTEADRFRVNSLVLAAIFLILLLLVRRLWLAAYLLATVLASYYAALGATVLAGIIWTGTPLPSVDWRVPFFLFTILVAVGEDYNILLMSRAMEESKRFGLAAGMRRALAKTGGAITSCGLIMAGTFATLMLAGLGTLLQIGFALAFGVLVDTFIVRPFLVPAFAIFVWGGTNEVKPAADQEEEAAAKREPRKRPRRHAVA